MPRFSCQTVFAARIQPEEIAERGTRGHAACGAAPGDQNVCCEIKFLRSLRGRNSGQ